MAKKVTDENTENLKREIGEWKSKYLRALADYQNLERRVGQERKELRERIVEEIIHGMLVILDNVQRAEKHLKDEGLTRAVKGFDSWLTYYNVKPIDVLNKQFNPHEMECVEVVNGEEGKVIEVLRPGYKLGDKVIRVAQVKVGKKSNNN